MGFNTICTLGSIFCVGVTCTKFPFPKLTLSVLFQFQSSPFFKVTKLFHFTAYYIVFSFGKLHDNKLKKCDEVRKSNQ